MISLSLLLFKLEAHMAIGVISRWVCHTYLCYRSLISILNLAYYRKQRELASAPAALSVMHQEDMSNDK